MLKIGLTGGIGSGKSTVAAMFEKKGILVIDADLIAREVIEPGQPAYEMVIQHFGKSILDDSQKHIHRQKLKNIIFSNPSEKIWLEQLLHPIILELMKVRAELAVSAYCILMIPLLKETQASHAMVDRILVVDAPTDLQIKRIFARDHLNETEVQKIMASQASRMERLSIADDVILNDKGKEDLEIQVKQLHDFYLQLSKRNID